MASYTTGKVGGAAAAGLESAAKSPSPTSVDLSERMATLAGASCLGTTPVKYHAIRFSIIVGAPVLAALATSASMGPELVAKVLVWFILTEFAGFGGADGQRGSEGRAGQDDAAPLLGVRDFGRNGATHGVTNQN